MAILGVDDFKAKLRGGGARSNLFKATINFPGYAAGDVEMTSFMCKGAQLPASTIEPVPIAFRGRQLQSPRFKRETQTAAAEGCKGKAWV